MHKRFDVTDMKYKKEMLSTDFQLALTYEMIEGKGEDSVLSVVGDSVSLVGAFDGCGGLGAKQYEAFGSHTGAYMASRAVSAAAVAWFEQIEDDRSMLNTCAFDEKIQAVYRILDRYADKSGTAFKGSMRKAFPSTVVVAITCFDSVSPEVTFVWAGDSRGYFWDKDGLHQITADDVKSEDAMENLRNDSPLTNVVAGDSPYVLHCHTTTVKQPTILLCATDGCFGYLQTPMDFEHLMLSTLLESQTPTQWKERITEALKKVAGDDFSLALHSIGFEAFDALKKEAQIRKDLLEDVFLPSSPDADSNECDTLWSKYKLGYESMLANKS